MTGRIATLVSAAAMLAGCNAEQSMLGGQGEHGAQFVSLFTIFLVVTSVFYVLVIGFLIASLVRRRRRSGDLANTVENKRHHASSPILGTGLAIWAALVTVGLAGLTVASFFYDRADARVEGPTPVIVKLTAHQFWWQVEYLNGNQSLNVRTANELHLPVNVPVHVQLAASDVIHSLWIPNLAGKQDLIPGREADIDLLPRKVGWYRGRCAEFCGVQHAHMALDVKVESKEDFERWYQAQLQPATAPGTPLAQLGYNYVTSRECAMCHNITGTPARGQVGPDLTHVASRSSIAAGTLPMNRGNLYGWIADPQAQKPGNHMPTVGLEPRELHGIVAYLEGLR